MIRVAVLTVSDRRSRGEASDGGGPAVARAVESIPGATVVARGIVADDRVAIASRLRALALDADLILTTGGTGIAERDVTPEATRDAIDRDAPGFSEEMRRRSVASFPRAILSRGVSGTIGRCLVLNLPGSPSGAVECVEFIAPVLTHAVKVLRGGLGDCQDDPEPSS